MFGARGPVPTADPPRNAHEQCDVVPSTADAQCTRLTPGAAIYVPPGHWHRVARVHNLF